MTEIHPKFNSSQQKQIDKPKTSERKRENVFQEIFQCGGSKTLLYLSYGITLEVLNCVR